MLAKLYLVALVALPVHAQGDVFALAIRHLGGTPARAGAFPATMAGFDNYLRQCGVRNVSARSLTRPNHPDVAARLGFQDFLPPKQWWPRGAALALIVEKLREVTGEPVEVRNWWRPAAYNADPRVGGARNGDHPDACAIDLDYRTPAGRMHAERWLRSLDRSLPALKLSLGLGSLTTHVGIGSARGHREWHYPGWVPGD